MASTKAAIDASDASLPTLAAQLRETEQTMRKLSAEPVNAPAARAVREAVDGLVEQSQHRSDERVAGRETDWVAHRARAKAFWAIIDEHGGSDAWPDEIDRFDAAWLWRFPHSAQIRLRNRGADFGPLPDCRAADAWKYEHFRSQFEK
jgi:hypothetical protein